MKTQWSKGTEDGAHLYPMHTLRVPRTPEIHTGHAGVSRNDSSTLHVICFREGTPGDVSIEASQPRGQLGLRTSKLHFSARSTLLGTKAVAGQKQEFCGETKSPGEVSVPAAPPVFVARQKVIEPESPVAFFQWGSVHC